MHRTSPDAFPPTHRTPSRLFSILLLLLPHEITLLLLLHCPAIRSVADVVNVVIIIPAARARARQLAFYGFWIKRALVGRYCREVLSRVSRIFKGRRVKGRARGRRSPRVIFLLRATEDPLSCSSNSTRFHSACTTLFFVFFLCLPRTSLVVSSSFEREGDGGQRKISRRTTADPTSGGTRQTVGWCCRFVRPI